MPRRGVPVSMVGVAAVLAASIGAVAAPLDLPTSPRPSAAAAAAPSTVVISEFMASVATEIPPGNTAHRDWIELWNPTSATVDLTGWHLTDAVTQPQQFTIGALQLAADARVVLFASGNPDLGPQHTNFKLSNDGEYLGLTDPAGHVVHEYAPTFPPQAADVSYGIAPDGSVTYLGAPTPGAPNVAPARRAAAPAFDVAGGLVDVPVTVAMTTTEPSSTIRYTTDGSVPSATNGATYLAPIRISTTTVLRAVTLAAGVRDSPPTTASYLFPTDVVRQEATLPGWPSGTVNGQTIDLGMDPGVVGGRESDVIASLRALPTISLVTDHADLTDPTTGIYVNATQRGSAWERPVSVELFRPGAAPVQIDGGLRIRGGYSRNGGNPKHSLRLAFDDADDGLLITDLFGDGTEAFDGIDLRTEQNHSWHEGDAGATYLRETWSRDAWAAIGHASTRSFWFHLYLDGTYWGMYEVEEQVDARWAAAHLGGAIGLHDVIGSDNTSYGYEVDEGDDDAWLRLWQRIADQSLDDDEYAAIAREVDLADLADYQLLLAYTGDWDATPSRFLSDLRANNWIAVGAPDAGIPWTFVPHDAEHSLGAVDHDPSGIDRTGPFPAGDANPYWRADYFNPGWLHQVLLGRAEYRAIVAQRLAALTGSGGVLTEPGARATWDARVAEVEPGLLAESARWGDARHVPALGLTEWAAEEAWVTDRWFPVRSAVVVAQVNARLAAATPPPPPTTSTTTTSTTSTTPTTATTPTTSVTPTTAPPTTPPVAGGEVEVIVASAAPVLLAPAVRLGVVDESAIDRTAAAPTDRTATSAGVRPAGPPGRVATVRS